MGRDVAHLQAARACSGRPPRRPEFVDDRFRLWREVARLDGLLFYLSLPYRIGRELRRFKPQIAVVQGVHEATALLIARALAGSDVKLILDVQGDWRAATRLYGSPARRLLNPLNDWLGRLAIRHADAIRVLSNFTAGLVRDAGREPDATFPPYTDSLVFWEQPVRPLPAQPRILFVGALELTKGIDNLLSAWRQVMATNAEAVLHIVGNGSRRSEVEEFVKASSGRVIWTPKLSPDGVADAMDQSVALCLPSRSEGLGRVAYESLARGRAVVGVAAGGIPDVIEDGRTGIIVEPEHPASLADALRRVLTDRELAERLGAEGRSAARTWLLTAEEFAERHAELFAGVSNSR